MRSAYNDGGQNHDIAFIRNQKECCGLFLGTENQNSFRDSSLTSLGMHAILCVGGSRKAVYARTIHWVMFPDCGFFVPK